jgi:hypothetical protein
MQGGLQKDVDRLACVLLDLGERSYNDAEPTARRKAADGGARNAPVAPRGAVIPDSDSSDDDDKSPAAAGKLADITNARRPASGSSGGGSAAGKTAARSQPRRAARATVNMREAGLSDSD